MARSHYLNEPDSISELGIPAVALVMERIPHRLASPVAAFTAFDLLSI